MTSRCCSATSRYGQCRRPSRYLVPPAAASAAGAKPSSAMTAVSFPIASAALGRWYGAGCSVRYAPHSRPASSADLPGSGTTAATMLVSISASSR
jgi:hypothetical protein